jgi:hypothetical protein
VLVCKEENIREKWSGKWKWRGARRGERRVEEGGGREEERDIEKRAYSRP